MLLFVNLSESDPDVSKGVINIGPKKARQLLGRQDQLREQKKTDDVLYSHEFFDYSCAFVKETDLYNEVEAILPPEVVYQVLDDDEDVVLHDDNREVWKVATDLNCRNLDCHTVVVTNNEFIWTALEKHGVASVKTVVVTREIIEKIAQEE